MLWPGREGAKLLQYSQRGRHSQGEIEGWLKAAVAARTAVPVTEVDPRVPFEAFGLDSVGAVEIVGELAAWLACDLPDTLLYDYPAIVTLAAHLTTGEDESATQPKRRDAQRGEPIAIIGMACRFPGADGPEAFWRLLAAGDEAVGAPPLGRFGAHAEAQAAALGFGAFIDGVDEFDPVAFGISPREAAQMDPQQRLLLEVGWEAVENAAIAAGFEGSSTGVYVGVSTSDYRQLQFRAPAGVGRYAATGTASSIAANRLSYAFDLRGPSLAVDTACSSSLVALHLACQALLTGECAQAIASGVNLMLSAETTLGLASLGLLSSDGRCRAFDAHGDGFVRGEGAGALVLKPLSDAIEDGDRVLALVRGSAQNSDGRTNGLTAPSRTAQESVLRAAYDRAGVSPGEIEYVEAHGTGTQLGDAVEANALGSVLGEDRPLGKICWVGSVKTNIGHLEAASGMASVIKGVLALQHQMLPPSLHFADPNRGIDFAQLPIAVATHTRPWETYGLGPRRAGVSAFGFGGTNAHVVLEEVLGD